MTPADGRARAAWASIGTGTIEAIKWAALLLMIGDHANVILLDRQWAWLNEIGRAVFPAFAFAFGYAISRVSEARRSSVYPRVLVRLLGAGALAQPLAMVGFGHDGLVLFNIMFTFAAGLALIWALQRGGTYAVSIAVSIALVAGANVEFMWPGIVLVVAMWAAFAQPGWASQLFVFACLLALWPVNGNAYALLIYPLVLLLTLSRVRIPRLRSLFYVAYPVHLAVLIGVRALLER